jgi:hypothetical protein
MSPKEKAKELVFKKFGCKKKYALKAVDEILSLFITDCEDTRYWKQVKQEIQNL